jgi:tRNA threonylcarbamoyladenosine biosynthesis protein TsaB
MKLHLDTTEFNQSKLVLSEGSQNTIASVTLDTGKQLTTLLVPALRDMLQRHNSTLHDLKEISVNEGPGGFTSTRVGVAVANALAFALQIPINGKLHNWAKPIYIAPPSINR